MKQITKRNRWKRVQDVIPELALYFNRVVLELDDWIRRIVRLYYWKQWKQLRTRWRNLIALGISPNEVTCQAVAERATGE